MQEDDGAINALFAGPSGSGATVAMREMLAGLLSEGLDASVASPKLPDAGEYPGAAQHPRCDVLSPSILDEGGAQAYLDWIADIPVGTEDVVRLVVLDSIGVLEGMWEGSDALSNLHTLLDDGNTAVALRSQTVRVLPEGVMAKIDATMLTGHMPRGAILAAAGGLDSGQVVEVSEEMVAADRFGTGFFVVGSTFDVVPVQYVESVA